jgi:hypothetical protein
MFGKSPAEGPRAAGASLTESASAVNRDQNLKVGIQAAGVLSKRQIVVLAVRPDGVERERHLGRPLHDFPGAAADARKPTPENPDRSGHGANDIPFVVPGARPWPRPGLDSSGDLCYSLVSPRNPAHGWSDAERLCDVRGINHSPMRTPTATRGPDRR